MFKVTIGLNDLIKIFIVRGIVFSEEQEIPYPVERDVHDYAATHILGESQGDPFASDRIHFIEQHAKPGRIVIRKP